MYKDFIEISTQTDDIIDITKEVEKIVKKSKVKEGLCLIFNEGSTGSILVNENEERLLEDLREMMEKLTSGRHRHPSNAHSHLKSTIIGPGKTIGIENGNLELGTWQSIMFWEFDVKSRQRRILVKVFGD